MNRSRDILADKPCFLGEGRQRAIQVIPVFEGLSLVPWESSSGRECTQEASKSFWLGKQKNKTWTIWVLKRIGDVAEGRELEPESPKSICPCYWLVSELCMEGQNHSSSNKERKFWTLNDVAILKVAVLNST